MQLTIKQPTKIVKTLLFSIGIMLSFNVFSAEARSDTYAIGDTGPGGGFIFFVTDDGKHGLEAAPNDQHFNIEWHHGAPLSAPVTSAVRSGIKTGRYNTDRILISQTGGNFAALVCANYKGGGYRDWYLPSKDELNAMYKNIGPGAPDPLTNLGGFADDRYWSSTETNRVKAWCQLFNIVTGQFVCFKNKLHRVRAIRSF